MKVVHREQQKRHVRLRMKSCGVGSGAKGRASGKDENVDDDMADLPLVRQQAEDSEHRRAMFAHFFQRNTTWVINSARLSQKPTMESTISALSTYTGKVTPYLHQLVEYRKAQSLDPIA